MKDIFKSSTHQAQFNELGYVVIEAGLENVIDGIEQFIKPYLLGIGTDFYYSLIANDLENNRLIKDKIAGYLNPFYKEYLTGYKSLNESFLTKPANTASELLLHQDWCYTDEHKFHSITLWMPLCDVDENNGAIFLLPRSHTWFNNLRSFSLPTARISSSELPDNKLHKVTMRKGDVLLFHPAVFHGSYPNNSNRHRTIVTSIVLPESANFTYFQAINNEQEKMVKAFCLHEDAFLQGLKTIASGADPDAEVFEQIHYNHPVVTSADLLAKVLV